ncbi:hypothetical protein RIF29_12950 [Crotalaria pallida]|uniref:Uncharacterized protein n=1 Tax=Crotalaria pallida TaxID=3830 RepID=A0AAN9IP01_CROPI
MAKQLKLKNKIMKILPKAAAAVRFQNLPFSPNRDHKSRTENTRHKGFSAPIVSIIPHEDTRRKPNNHGSNNNNGNNDYQEPTSPKISCMGQIKHEKKRIKKAKAKDIDQVKKHVSTFQKMLFYAAKPKSASSAKLDSNKDVLAERVVPNMSQMRRFASGRDTLANFEWKDQVVPEDIDCCYESDGEEEEEEEEEEVIIPFSAPIMLNGRCGSGDDGVLKLKPRNEINLWKRRTMAQPMPLKF